MGKLQKNNDLKSQRISRSLLAVSLAASLAALGCTTNLNPGNGTPTRSGPELRSAPTSGVTSGSETVTPPPMTSSYTRAEALPRVTARRGVIRRSAEEAAAIMAGRQTLRGRYLGPANPGPGGRPYQSDFVHGGFVNPAVVTNPQLTINSTISSPSTAAISSGAGGFAGSDAGVNVATNGVTTTGATAGATLPGAATTGTTATTATGVGLPAGTFASTARPAVTESISNNPAVTAASAGFGRTGAGVLRSGVTTTGTAAATTNATNAPATVGATTGTGTVTANTTASGGVRVIRGSTGGVTITNTGTRNQ